MAERPKAFVPSWIGQRRGFLPSWASDGAIPPAPATTGPRPLLLRGGTCVFPGLGALDVDLAMAGGRIAAVGLDLPAHGYEIVDVKGKYVLPGVVDPHVHLGVFGDFAEELHSETRSAVRNGVTTIGLYFGGMDPYLKHLDRVVAQIRRISHADVFIHLPIFTREQLKEIPSYAARYGISSFKAYMCGLPGLIPSVDDAFLFDLMEAVASLGHGAVLCIHAENEDLVNRAAQIGLARNPAGLDAEAWAEARPSYVEEEALVRAEFLARETHAQVYFVHISSAAGVAAVRRMKKDGRRIFAETTSPYLTMEPDDPSDSRAIMVPPLRGREDRKALWEGLIDGTLDTVGTDHTPLSSSQKHLQSKAPAVVPGYPAIGTHLPSLLDGARRHGLSILSLAERICGKPAEIFGIFPRKGTLLPGSDADVVVIEPDKDDVVTPQRAASRSDFTLHEGQHLVGWPNLVIKGGRPVSPGDDKGLSRGDYLPRRVGGRPAS